MNIEKLKAINFIAFSFGSYQSLVKKINELIDKINELEKQ